MLMSITELQELTKEIDSHFYCLNNTQIYDEDDPFPYLLCIEPPEDENIESKQDEIRIDKIIKDFCNKKGS